MPAEKLPLALDVVLSTIVHPGLALLPTKMNSAAARVGLLAIGLQESRFKHRYQVLNDPALKGPARGFWQFEKGGGVRGVMQHPASTGFAHLISAERGVPFSATELWLKLEVDDLLACAFARLLLFTDRKPLPEIGDSHGMWMYYLRNWGPGKPHPATWPENYRLAVEAVQAEEA